MSKQLCVKIDAGDLKLIPHRKLLSHSMNENTGEVNDTNSEQLSKNKKQVLEELNYKYKRRIRDGKNLICSTKSYASGIAEEKHCSLKRNRFSYRYVRYGKKLNINYCYSSAFILAALLITFAITEVAAGTCWRKPLNNGKCTGTFMRNTSKEECCRNGIEFGFTVKEMSEIEYFFSTALGNAAVCVSCLDKCENADCGPGKRCVMKKGRPKCICAPICKSSKSKERKKIYNNRVRRIDVSRYQKAQFTTPRHEDFNFDSIFPGISFEDNKEIARPKREELSASAVNQPHHNETDKTSPESASETIKRKGDKNNRNQRKKNNLRKRRKQKIGLNSTSTTTTPATAITESTTTSLRGGVPKRHKDRIIIAAEGISPNINLEIIENSSNNSKHKKNLGSSNGQAKKKIIIVQNSEFFDSQLEQLQQQQQQHHSRRHQYKKDQREHRNKFRDYIAANDTTSIRPAHYVRQSLANNDHKQQKNKPKKNGNQNVSNRFQIETSTSSNGRNVNQKNRDSNKQQRQQQKLHQSPFSSVISELSLDEKIRNGYYSHGFPYPDNDLTQISKTGHSQYYNPVCGTDGKTYNTECQLKKRACRQDSTTLTVAYRGHCQTSCKLVKCSNELQCVEDQYGLPHCIICSINCREDELNPILDPSRAICGADGRTYKSICDINRLICTTGRSVAIAYDGPCQDAPTCNNVHCGPKKVCLNDLINQRPHCISCSFKCPRKRRPQGRRYDDIKICGTNNITYSSWCQMRRDSCNTGFHIDMKHVGACKKDLFADLIGGTS